MSLCREVGSSCLAIGGDPGPLGRLDRRPCMATTTSLNAHHWGPVVGPALRREQAGSTLFSLSVRPAASEPWPRAPLPLRLKGTSRVSLLNLKSGLLSKTYTLSPIIVPWGLRHLARLKESDGGHP